MESNKYYSPIDNSKDEYISLTYQEFYDEVVTNNEYNWTKYVISDTHKRYDITSVKKDGGLLYTCNCRENNHDKLDMRFKYTEEERRGYYGGSPTTYREMIPITLEEIYNVLKPCYRKKYLVNGKYHKKEWN